MILIINYIELKLHEVDARQTEIDIDIDIDKDKKIEKEIDIDIDKDKDTQMGEKRKTKLIGKNRVK